MIKKKQCRVYMIRCGDGTFYTGQSQDIWKRFKQHCANKGAKYTKGRGALELVYAEKAISRSQAMSREHAIKTFTRKKKQALIKGSTNKLLPRKPNRKPKKPRRF